MNNLFLITRILIIACFFLYKMNLDVSKFNTDPLLWLFSISFGMIICHFIWFGEARELFNTFAPHKKVIKTLKAKSFELVDVFSHGKFQKYTKFKTEKNLYMLPFEHNSSEIVIEELRFLNKINQLIVFKNKKKYKLLDPKSSLFKYTFSDFTTGFCYFCISSALFKGFYLFSLIAVLFHLVCMYPSLFIYSFNKKEFYPYYDTQFSHYEQHGFRKVRLYEMGTLKLQDNGYYFIKDKKIYHENTGVLYFIKNIY